MLPYAGKTIYRIRGNQDDLNSLEKANGQWLPI